MKTVKVSKDELQKAHDILAAIVLGKVPHPFEQDGLIPLQAALDCLCWVLRHDHNVSFANNLAKIEAFLAERGYVLERLTLNALHSLPGADRARAKILPNSPRATP